HCACSRTTSGARFCRSRKGSTRMRNTLRVALYARYSSDQPSETSIEDQLRLLREFAKKQGWTIVEVFTDYEVSGKLTLTRPGYQAMLDFVTTHKIDVVLSEGLDRLNRRLKDSAALLEDMNFAKVQLHTLKEGRVTTMHVAFKGAQNEMFLDDMRAAVQRGMRGTVERGNNASGISYGYRATLREDKGRMVPGGREVNEAEAAIVRRIFDMYLAGDSSKTIAKTLNAEGIPGPRSKPGKPTSWNPSTIHGDAAKGTGILNNEIYIGRTIWNRTQWVQHPRTEKRVPRLNPPDQWVINERPELRIVSQKVWDAARARSNERKAIIKASGHNNLAVAPTRYLLSGLLKCGACGGSVVMHSNGRLACSGYKQRGTCTNDIT